MKNKIIIVLLCFVFVVGAGVGAGFLAGNILRSRPVEEITEVTLIEENTKGEVISEDIENAEETVKKINSTDTEDVEVTENVTVTYTITETTHIADEEISVEEAYSDSVQSLMNSSEIKNAVLEKIRSNASGMDGEFVIFDSETKDTDTEIIFYVRYQSNNAGPDTPANQFYAQVNVDKIDGTMLQKNFFGEEYTYDLCVENQIEEYYSRNKQSKC